MKKLFFLLMIFPLFGTSQNWNQVTNFIAVGRHHPITFSNNNYGFVVSGSFLNDIYKYDKSNDTWNQLQNIPFSGRGYAYGVSLGNMAYMGFGSTASGLLPTDWWEYDMDNDIWNQKAEFPGDGRRHPAMVVVNNKIYMGCGSNNSGNLGDWWEYDMDSDIWNQKADFPAIERHHPFFFNINNFAYIGFGHSNSGILKDFYQYNPSNDTWIQLNDFPGEGRVAGTQFSYNTKGYILSGDGDDHGPLDTGEFWEYESSNDSWTQLTSHPGGAIWAPGSFVINSDIYFLLGKNNSTNSLPLNIYKYNFTVNGCTDSLALNYDPLATVDDGSCITDIYGCTGPTYCNYDSSATIDDGSCTGMFGCMDPLYGEYSSAATCDDGSCLLIIDAFCTGSPITGLFVSSIIDDRAVVNFDNMNTYDASGAQICRIDQIRIRYRALGANVWSQKTIASPTGYDATTGICNSTQKTDKNIYTGLTLGTTYEWEARVWYCSTGATAWVVGPNFTTLDECPNITNFSAYGANPTKATFTWDASNGSYEFVRLKSRVDSISNPTGSDWFQIGGFGVTYGTYTKSKNGLVSGEAYRAQARTFCDPNGGAYNSLSWTSLVTWTQPISARLINPELTERTLSRITDLLGREVNSKSVIHNTTLFYIYNDGTVEKRIIIK